MISNLISCAEKPDLKLTVRVKTIDLGFPNSAERIRQALMDHLMQCRHCLVTLFEDSPLAEAGCEECKQMFSRLESERGVRKALAADEHLNQDAMEEYCFNRLSRHESALFEQHLAVCHACREQVERRLEFILCLKAALRERAAQKLDSGILGGVLGIHASERELTLCAPIAL